MNRRQFLLGATTVGGGVLTFNQYRDQIPELPELPEPNLRSGNSNETATNETDVDFDNAKYSDYAELMKWRYWHFNPDHTGPNNYEGEARAKVKNVGDVTYDYKVKFTPIHKNGNELKTHDDEKTIKPLEFKTFEADWPGDDSTRYVDSLRLEIFVSDQKWFNGWEQIYGHTHEF